MRLLSSSESTMLEYRLLVLAGLVWVCSCAEIAPASELDSRPRDRTEDDTNTEVTDDSDSDGCPEDPLKTEPLECGCGRSEADADEDGVLDCKDLCPAHPNKSAPGVCGCEFTDVDADEDGVMDCEDLCPTDPNKTTPGVCGCHFAEGPCPITGEALVGYYERLPVENDWHKVNVTLEGGALRWGNAAGVSWSLNLVDGVLTTGSDCPYDVKTVGIETSGGSTVTGLTFNAELYVRR
ncbi:MAG: hypothetical protein MUC50_19125 [Myxococcota bacterium]|jgi:hypothetical protein|nr:hypothetical protein [Myxococcota bacterium]